MTTRPGVTAVLLAALVLWLGPAPAARAADPARLTDDAGGRPLFGGAALSPGSAQNACLTVTASGAAAGDGVTVAATGVTGGLAAYLNVTIEAGTGTTGGGRCTSFSGTRVFSGTLAALGALTGDGADTGWAPANPADTGSKAFRITVSLISDPAAMGQTATASFAWRLVPGPVTTPTPTPTDPTPTTDAPTTPATPTDGPTTTPATTGPTVAPVPPGPTTTSTTVAGGDFAGPTDTPGEITSSPIGTGPPKAEVTVPGLPGGPQNPSASGGGHGLAAKVGAKVVKVAHQAVDVVQGLAQKPQYTFGPLLLAVLFLFLQHLVDLRDPKLAKAFRTQRDLMLEFPDDYGEVEER